MVSAAAPPSPAPSPSTTPPATRELPASLGTLPFDAGLPTTSDRLARLPVLVAHDDADTAIPADLLTRTWSYLHGEAGSTTTGVRDPGGHGIGHAVLGELQTWLRDLDDEASS